MRTLLARAVRATALALLALVLLFEEWGWAPLAAAFAFLARLPVLRRVEASIMCLRPWLALCVLAAPALLLLPVKLLSLYLFGTGHPATGILLLILAKLAGTALVAWLFALTQPALMQLAWFARGYPRWKEWKDRLLVQVRTSALWQAGGRLKRTLLAKLRVWWTVS